MKNVFCLILPLFLGAHIMATPLQYGGPTKFNIYVDAGTFIVLNSTTVNLEAHLASSGSNRIHWYLRGGVGTAEIMFLDKDFGGLGAITILPEKMNIILR